jgi:DNA-binding transcriptional ArsR family regulator
VLREARLVTEHREGTRRIYRLEPEGLSVLRIYLEGFWWDALAAFKQAAETTEGSEG